MSDPNPKRRGNPLMRAGAPSLNPAGRPKRGESFAERVRAIVDLDKLIEFLDETARDPGAKMEHRLAAAAQLLDRAVGRPVATVELEASVQAATARPSVDWSRVPLERRLEILAALREARALPSGSGE